MTKNDIAKAIYDNVGGLSHTECQNIVNTVFQIMKDELIAGNNVKITRFGNFTLINKASRIGRNPKTKKAYPISARTVVSFKAGNHLKKALNEDN